MKKVLIVTGILLFALLGSYAQAKDFEVQGSSASGHPGDRVFVQLVYDYGTSFGAIAEDLQFEYDSTALEFIPDASTIDVFGAAQNLLEYANALQGFAQLHQGDVVFNLKPLTSKPIYKGYALLFYTTDGAGQIRNGQVNLRAAFDIAPSALPGVYAVSFLDTNLLVDENGNEFSYPIELQSLSVTVTAVPEPSIYSLFLLGLALLGIRHFFGWWRTNGVMSKGADASTQPCSA